MARKSRKNLPQQEQAAVSALLPELEEAKMPAAIYGRLSVEDEEKEESMETQIALVQDYINRSSELSYVDTYFDNGFTGTNFKRPAWLLKLMLVMITLPLILAVWLAKWFVVFLHHCSAWIFYLLGSVLLATAILSYLMQQSQGMEALQMLIGGFVIFMIPQVVGGVVVLLELAAVMLRQVWYI